MNGDGSIFDDVAKERMDDAFRKANNSGKKEDQRAYDRLKAIYYRDHYKLSSDGEESSKWSGDDTGWGFNR